MFVGSFAFISTRVFGIAIQNVQDDYSKIVESSESMSSRQGFAIFEPFDFQVRIFNGSQFCFQMATLSFSNVKLFVETRYKFGRSNIFGSGWSYISTFWKILKNVLNTGCFVWRHPVESSQTLHVKCARYHLSPHEQKAFTGTLRTGVIAHFYSRIFAILWRKKQLSLISGAEPLVAHSLLVLHSGSSLPRLLPPGVK